MKSLTVFVAFCIAVIIAYTVTAIIVQCAIGVALDSALTVGVYGFFGTELCAACVIKVFKIRKEGGL